MIAHLGSAEAPKRDGYINVDIRPNAGVDVVADISKGLPFKDGELDGVINRNLIEHFGRHEVAEIIKEWVRVVKQHGTIQIETVEMGKLADNWRKASEDEVLDGFFGAQTYDHNYHKFFTTKENLTKLLDEAGVEVTDVREWELRNIPRIQIIGEKR